MQCKTNAKCSRIRVPFRRFSLAKIPVSGILVVPADLIFYRPRVETACSACASSTTFLDKERQIYYGKEICICDNAGDDPDSPKLRSTLRSRLTENYGQTGPLCTGIGCARRAGALNDAYRCRCKPERAESRSTRRTTAHREIVFTGGGSRRTTLAIRRLYARSVLRRAASTSSPPRSSIMQRFTPARRF